MQKYCDIILLTLKSGLIFYLLTLRENETVKFGTSLDILLGELHSFPKMQHQFWYMVVHKLR